MDPVFSRPGEAPTGFERQLLEGAHVARPVNTRELWLLIAQRAGLDTLLTVLDEFGDGSVWVPSRRTFFASIGRPALEQAVGSMIELGLSRREIARRLCMSPTQVHRIAIRRGTSPHGTAPANRETQRG